MASLLCLVVDRSPYGGIEPAEAIRHAGGALGKGWEVVLAFTGQSVYTALRGQSPPAGKWLSLSEALTKLIADGRERVRLEAAAFPVRRESCSIDSSIEEPIAWSSSTASSSAVSRRASAR